MKQIVVGVDGSDGSQRALQWAVDEALVHGANVAADLLVVGSRGHGQQRKPSMLPSGVSTPVLWPSRCNNVLSLAGPPPC